MRFKLSPVTGLILGLTLFLSSCSGPSCSRQTWQDINWELKSYGTAVDPQPVVGAGVTLRFHSQDQTVNGSTGCNDYFGGYTVDADCILTITGLGATKKACSESGVMQQEQTYLWLLQNAGQIEIVNGELHLTSGSSQLIFTK